NGGGWGGGGWGGGFDVGQMAERRFQGSDRNGGGILNFDEKSENLQKEREKWDADMGGFINPAEVKAYFKARTEPSQAENNDPSKPGYGGPMAPDEDKKPVVFRAGKLPPNIPSWFVEADKDRDAQVALYEWKEKGWGVDEFNKWDRNNDGFVTVEEVLFT